MAKTSGQNSRSKTRRKNATSKANGSGAESGSPTQGEDIAPPGSRYSAVLNERANQSLLSDEPGRPMANKGYVGSATKGSRNTGKVGS